MTELDFQILDDILSLADPDSSRELCSVALVGLGPALELLLQNPNTVRSIVESAQPSPTIIAINNLFRNTPQLVTGDILPCEIVRTPPTIEDVDQPVWNSFLIRAQRASEASGAPKNLAQALIGTLQEMSENVVWHSCAANTGLAGYRWTEGIFEYFVGDLGIGVLKSLRQNLLYTYLDNSIDALHLALNNGVSRFPLDANRGTGFNSLLRNIAKNCCDLRFHTSDAVIVYEGIASFMNSTPIKVKDATAPNLSGFTISLHCKIK